MKKCYNTPKIDFFIIHFGFLFFGIVFLLGGLIHKSSYVRSFGGNFEIANYKNTFIFLLIGIFLLLIFIWLLFKFHRVDVCEKGIFINSFKSKYIVWGNVNKIEIIGRRILRIFIKNGNCFYTYTDYSVKSKRLNINISSNMISYLYTLEILVIDKNL